MGPRLQLTDISRSRFTITLALTLMAMFMSIDLWPNDSLGDTLPPLNAFTTLTTTSETTAPKILKSTSPIARTLNLMPTNARHEENRSQSIARMPLSAEDVRAPNRRQPSVRQAVFPLGYLPTQSLDAPQPFGAYTQNDVHKGRWVMASVSSYCPCALCCGTHDKITANGANTDAMPYNFAADKSLPFGTHISVPLGLGVLDSVRRNERTFIVDDRGGALDTEARRYGILRLDLRVRDHWWAVNFGRRMIPVFITSS